MTVVLESAIQRYTCVAADVKPAAGVVQGSICVEIDTGKLFLYNGAAWVEQPPDRAGALTVDGAVTVSGTATVTQGAAGAAAWPTKDAGPSWTSSRTTTISADMTGAADLTAAPTAGQKIVIDDVIASSDTALYISFLEETSGTEIFRMYLSAGSTGQFTPRSKLQLPTADKKLRGDASLAGNVCVMVLYHSEA